MKYYIKLITGFRENQFEIIPMQEAHKAYYLFNHPEERGVFENGVAIIGRNIQEIKPAWNETMGWNPTYELGDDDWNEISRKEVDVNMKWLLEKSKKVSDLIEKDKSLMKRSLKDVIIMLPENVQFSEEVKKLSDKYKI